MALEMIRRGTSPMPIGLTPGHLFNGRRRQAMKALRASELTREVQSLRPTAAREEQRSLEADLNEEHSRRQAKASRPARPAAPLVLSAAFEIRSASRLSKMMELGVSDCWSSGRRISGEGAVLAGCLSARISRTERIVIIGRVIGGKRQNT